MFFILSTIFVIFFGGASLFLKRGLTKEVKLMLRVVAGVFFLFMAISSLAVIPAGHIGVMDTFGKVSKNTLKSGVNFKNPMAKVIKMSIKTQEFKEKLSVPSIEGLMVALDVSILFNLDAVKSADIYKTVGKNYAEVILKPQLRSVIRGITASYEAKALYTSDRDMLSNKITTELNKLVSKRGVNIESVPMRQMTLPPQLAEAISRKLEAEQESQKMEWILQKETQEAERKRIEAKGISDFQNIVSKGISEPLLRWKGIEATERLAESQNAKIVIVGGKNGLPLILNTK